MKTIKVDYEHNCETWWDNAREEAKHNPPEACVGLLDSVNEISVDDEDANAFMAWAEQIDGWNEQPFVVSDAPLVICGKTIQYDKSGVGHCWIDASEHNCPPTIQEEIAAEIIDGQKKTSDGERFGNGQYYRW